MPAHPQLSYQGLIDDATQTLYTESETPRIDAEVLMQHVVKRSLAWLIAYGDTKATAEHTRLFFKLINQRHQGHPIAYLTGEKEFWSLPLKVDNNVLIPRPDTETLVEQALARIDLNSDAKILDLGTGSGAIALAIAKERPKSSVLGVDSQAAALAVALANAANNKITNAEFLQSDWYAELPKNTRYDLIASNPPYVESGDPHLEQGDLRFEPITGLVAKENGLADLSTIIAKATGFLKPQGWLIVEHGYAQANEVKQLFDDNGFVDISCYQDINDLPRCTAGCLK